MTPCTSISIVKFEQVIAFLVYKSNLRCGKIHLYPQHDLNFTPSWTRRFCWNGKTNFLSEREYFPFLEKSVVSGLLKRLSKLIIPKYNYMFNCPYMLTAVRRYHWLDGKLSVAGYIIAQIVESMRRYVYLALS